MTVSYYETDGTSSAIGCGTVAVTDFTVAFQVNPVQLPILPITNGMIFSCYDSGTGNQIQLQLTSTSNEFYVSIGGSSGFGTITTIYTPVGSWRSVVITRNGSTGVVSLYVNGSFITSVTAGTGSMSLSGMLLGAFVAPGYFVSINVAQFGVWNMVLTSGDISAINLGNDPTMIENSNLIQYQPLQVNPLDIFGASITNTQGTPVLIGGPPAFTTTTGGVAWSSTNTIAASGTGPGWVTGQLAPLANVGTVASDVISGVTARTFSYTSPSSGSSATFLDPTTGATVAIALSQYAVLAVLNHSAAHSPGDIQITLSYAGGSGPGSTIYTLTPTVGSMSGTITLTSGAATGTAKLTIPGSVSPASESINITNNSGGSVATIAIGFSVVALTARLRSFAIMPGGNIWRAYFERVSDSSATFVTSCDPTLGTIQVNGGPLLPLCPSNLPMFPGYAQPSLNWVWGFFGTARQQQVIDEADAGCVLGGGGTWVQVTTAAQSSAHYQLFGWPSNGNGAGALHYNANASATAIYTFSGLTPGATYKFYFNRPDYFSLSTNGWYSAGNGSPATTDARYTVTDGTNTAHVDVDLTSTSYSYDESDLTYALVELLSFTMSSSPPQTTATLTLSNQAGSKLLPADGIWCILQTPRTVNPGDTVVAQLRDGWINTGAGTVGPSPNLSIPVLTPSQAFPYDASAPKLAVGFDLPLIGQGFSGRILANQTKYGSYWTTTSGDWAIDSHRQLSRASTTAGHMNYFQFLDSGFQNFPAAANEIQGNGIDYFGAPTARVTGAWTFKFTVPSGGMPTVGAAGTFGEPNVDSISWGALSAGSYTKSWTPTYTGLEPHYNVPLWVSVESDGNAASYITDLVILPPGTPSNWTMKSDRDLYNRMIALPGGGYLRDLLPCSANASNTVDPTEDISPLALNYTGSAANGGIASGVLNSLQPVTASVNPTYYAIANALYGSLDGPPFACLAVFNSAHDIGPAGTQRLISWTLGTSGFTDTLGNSVSIGTVDAFVVDSTHILFFVYTTNGTRGTVSSLTATYTAVSGDLYTWESSFGMPPSDVIDVANECGKVPWINIPGNANDAYPNAIGQYCAANHPTKSVGIAYDNEAWNDFGVENWERAEVQNGWQNYLYSTTSGAQGAQLVGGTYVEYYPWRATQVHNQARAGFTGIPEVRIAGPGVGAQAVAAVAVSGGPVTGITLTHGGSGYTSAPIVTLIGGAGSGATVTATVAAGAVTGFTSLVGGSGYTTTGFSPALVIRIMETGLNQPPFTQVIGNHCYANNTNFDLLAYAPYINAFDPYTSPSSGYMYSAWDMLADQGDLVDAVSFAFLGAGTSRVMAQQLTTLQACGPGGYFAAVIPVTYEGGPQDMALGASDPVSGFNSRLGRRGLKCLRDPNFFYLDQAWLYDMATVAGVKALTRFTSDDQTGMGDTLKWQTWWSSDTGMGTGTAGENNTNNMRAMVSQEAGGMAAYLSTPTPTPTATDTDLLLMGCG